MIRIIEGQFAQTLQREPDRFFDGIVQHLIESNPEELRGIPLTHIRDMVEMGVQRARLHGLVDDSDLFAFVSVMFEIAPNFDEEPTLRAALEAPAQNPKERWESLFGDQFNDAWERAAHPNAYDPAAWLKPTPRKPAGAATNG
jgi:hypothetical protein